MLSIQGNSQSFTRIQSDFNDQHMSMLETDGVPNLEFINKLVTEYDMQVTIGLVSYGHISEGRPYPKLDVNYFATDSGDDEDDW